MRHQKRAIQFFLSLLLLISWQLLAAKNIENEKALWKMAAYSNEAGFLLTPDEFKGLVTSIDDESIRENSPFTLKHPLLLCTYFKDGRFQQIEIKKLRIGGTTPCSGACQPPNSVKELSGAPGVFVIPDGQKLDFGSVGVLIMPLNPQSMAYCKKRKFSELQKKSMEGQCPYVDSVLRLSGTEFSIRIRSPDRARMEKSADADELVNSCRGGYSSALRGTQETSVFESLGGPATDGFAGH